MSRVHCVTETILQLTTFGPWKRMNLKIHTSSRFFMTKTTNPCATPANNYRLGAHNVVPHVDVAVNHVQNLCLLQNHQVVVPDLHSLYGLGEAKDTPVPDIVSCKV